MKHFLYIAAMALLASCVTGLGSTTAKGDIVLPVELQSVEYKVLIKDYDHKTGRPQWVEWEPWVLNGSYLITIQTNDVGEALFLSRCGSDTLARLTVYANYGKHKIKKTILLDGSHYELGKPIYREVGEERDQSSVSSSQ